MLFWFVSRCLAYGACAVVLRGIVVRGLHVETFVRVLRSSRVNFKISVNNTNMFHCVWIESLFILFCCSIQVCVTKAVSIYKMQFLVELLVDIKIL